MQQVLCVIGTRPEVIKMAPVVVELRRSSHFSPCVVLTGQHKELVAQAMECFDLRADMDLGVMTQSQSLHELSSSLVRELGRAVESLRPRWVLAQGDTTSVLASALVAFYQRIPFGHVEAGLRTHDLSQPFPEELNRRVADMTATLLFAPTERASTALIQEGVSPSRVVVTGNTIVDALGLILKRAENKRHRSIWNSKPGILRVLITAHRRESFGETLKRISEAIRELARQFGDGVHFVFCLHLNPQARRPALELLSDEPNVTLIEPPVYDDLIQWMSEAHLILTDSGGIQEEAPTLKVPVVVLRETTERPEGIDEGVAILAGTDPRRIIELTGRLLRDEAARSAMVARSNPYGDGYAAERIVRALVRHDSSE